MITYLIEKKKAKYYSYLYQDKKNVSKLNLMFIFSSYPENNVKSKINTKDHCLTQEGYKYEKKVLI